MCIKFSMGESLLYCSNFCPMVLMQQFYAFYWGGGISPVPLNLCLFLHLSFFNSGINAFGNNYMVKIEFQMYMQFWSNLGSTIYAD